MQDSLRIKPTVEEDDSSILCRPRARRFSKSRLRQKNSREAQLTNKLAGLRASLGIIFLQLEDLHRHVPALLLLLAAQRAFINCESLLRPAAVSPPFFAEEAVFVPAALRLAAQRALISSESFLRPAGVSAPFFLPAAGFVLPLRRAQRALAAADSLARVEGEK